MHMCPPHAHVAPSPGGDDGVPAYAEDFKRDELRLRVHLPNQPVHLMHVEDWVPIDAHHLMTPRK